MFFSTRKYSEKARKAARLKVMYKGSLIATACTRNNELLITKRKASTIPAICERVIRQPIKPNRKALTPNRSAFKKRAPRKGSRPPNPTKANTDENPGGKWVTGPLLASQA